jgi:uncharacterized RDD family membrane protein YckC
MTSSNAGWYPDPQDARLMRWWDGSGWTEDVYERTEPLGGPLDHRTPFAAPAEVTSPAGAADQASSDPYLPGPKQQPAPQPYPAAPTATTSARQGSPTTPDGVRLASWGLRAVARILDLVIVSLVALVISFPTVSDLVQDAWRDAERAAEAGVATTPMLTDPTMLKHIAYVTFVQLLVGLVYEVAFLLWKAATPGKLALRLRVRRWDAGQRLTPTVVVRRWIAYQGAQALPYVGTPYVIIDLLWPVRDARRQALHDKFARTCVVVTPRH